MDADIDPDIGLWILEFLLREPLNYRLLIHLTEFLPLPNNRLKKLLLLRTIEFEISKGRVSENILDYLEQIEALDFQNGIEKQSALIRDAYCAVAVTCTVKMLADNGKVDSCKYLGAVERIWRCKVCKLEERKAAELVSEELLGWKVDIEEGLLEKSSMDKLLKLSEGMDAIGALRAYVDEEKGKMGPSFLEFVAQTMNTDDKSRELLCNAGSPKCGKAAGKLLPDADHELGHSIGKTELKARDSFPHKEIVLTRRKHVAMKRFRGMPRGVKIADTDNSVDDKCKKCDIPSTSEVDKVQEAPKSSKSDIQSTLEVDEVHESPNSSKCDLPPTSEVDEVQEALKRSKSDLRSTLEVDEVQESPNSSKCDIPPTSEVDKVQEAPKSGKSDLLSTLEVDEVQESPNSSKCDIPPTSEVDKVQEALKSSTSDLLSTLEVDEVQEALNPSKCDLAPTPKVHNVQEVLKSSKVGLPPTPEIEKMQESLKSSSLELHAVVKDPLPYALLMAESLITIAKGGNTSKVPVEESAVRINPLVAESSTAVQANTVHVSSSGQVVKENALRSSLMERNSTACTFEWDDSIDGSPEDLQNGSRLHLPSPKRRLVSPLKNFEPPDKLCKRRKTKKWTLEEEDTLRSAVAKYGCGNWKFILNAYPDIFEERTQVDLKDKWRRMTR